MAESDVVTHYGINKYYTHILLQVHDNNIVDIIIVYISIDIAINSAANDSRLQTIFAYLSYLYTLIVKFDAYRSRLQSCERRHVYCFDNIFLSARFHLYTYYTIR